MWTRRSFVLSMLLSLGAVDVGLAAETPLPVSPGDASGEALVEGRCPTFNWGSVEQARSYDLVVYLLGEEGEEAKPVLNQRIAGSALGWTPSLERCLERGRRYAWSVRALGRMQESNWSPPSLFGVARGPSEVEFEDALRVVQDYLSETGSAAPTDTPKSVTTENLGESPDPSRADVTGNPRPEAATAAVGEAAVGPDFSVDDLGNTVVRSRLGIGNASPVFPLAIRANQAVASLDSTLSDFGSVLELRNTSPGPIFPPATPILSGAINFNNAANTTPGQIAYKRFENELTFRTNNVEQMRITSTGDVTNNLDANGLVKAWARVTSLGEVTDCYKCNKRDLPANKISTGVYRIDFTPSGLNPFNRPILCSARGPEDATIRCNGVASAVHVVGVDIFLNGNPSDGGFSVVLF